MDATEQTTADDSSVPDDDQLDDPDRWEYPSDHNIGIVTSRLIEGTIMEGWDDTTGLIETLPVDHHGAPISITVETEREERVSTIVHLSPNDARAFAHDLLAQADAADRVDE